MYNIIQAKFNNSGKSLVDLGDGEYCEYFLIRLLEEDTFTFLKIRSFAFKINFFPWLKRVVTASINDSYPGELSIVAQLLKSSFSTCRNENGINNALAPKEDNKIQM